MGPVVWVGGAPAAGKSTVARALARRYGLRLYAADTRTWVHRDRALARGILAARAFETLSPLERWQRPTAELVAMSLHRERGPMVLDDLAALPDRPLVVAEGTTLPASAADPTKPWAAGDTDAMELQLVCECGDPGCERLVLRRIADYRSPSLAEH
jgi:hypothetical protein